MSIRVLGAKEMDSEIRYWSVDTCDRRCLAEFLLKESDLSDKLLKAYSLLHADDTCCLLVKTFKGFGIALTYEYDRYFAKDRGLTSEELFEYIKLDAKQVEPLVEPFKADIIIGRHSTCTYCYKLMVIFPPYTDPKKFKAVIATIEQTL